MNKIPTVYRRLKNDLLLQKEGERDRILKKGTVVLVTDEPYYKTKVVTLYIEHHHYEIYERILEDEKYYDKECTETYPI